MTSLTLQGAYAQFRGRWSMLFDCKWMYKRI